MPLSKALSIQRKALLHCSRSVGVRPTNLPASCIYPLLHFNQHIKRRMSAAAMSSRLEGKTIVITGASSGIGRSTALEFALTAPRNLKLVLTARRLDAVKELAAEIEDKAGKGVKVHTVKMDVSKKDEVDGFVGDLPDDFKEIDILVNNA